MGISKESEVVVKWRAVLLLLAGVVVCFFLLPFYLSVVLVVVLAVLRWRRQGAHKFRWRVFFIGCCAGAVIKMAALAGYYVHLNWTPVPERGPARYNAAMREVPWWLGFDGPGLFEYVYSSKYRGIKDLRGPFTGDLLRYADGRLYSVGPNGRDEGGVVAYDPTNGVVSPGDVVVWELDRTGFTERIERNQKE
jgi:hypothetical protein